MNLEKINSVYFVGIGGIGMSALARYFHSKGKNVAGYDRVSSFITQELENEGMKVTFDDDQGAVGQTIGQHSKDETLIIVTPAIPEDHPQLKFFRENEYDIRKRAQVLGEIVKQYHTIAVAGTHGKTTTAAMITQLFHHSGVPCYAFLGGVSANLRSNYLEPPQGKTAEICIVEADEYDRSFLHLSPDVLIINSLDADHLDVYGDDLKLIEAYQTLCGQVRKSGHIFCRRGIEYDLKINDPVTFDLEGRADVYPENVEDTTTATQFSLKFKDQKIDGFQLHQKGRHNLLNAVAAVSASIEKIGDFKKLKAGLATFKGLNRRFEIVWKGESSVFIDDYAHHPRELEMVIESCRSLYPGKKLTGVFQPHLFSRTRDFMDDFAHILSELDEVIILPIYPAREKPIEGISSKVLYDRIPAEKKWLIERDELPEFIKEHDTEVLLTLGAGDIDRIVQPVKEVLQNKKGKNNA